ncbi:MAG: hypothetical protein M3355_12115 [Actinomycetota bacterium]|nr:hypothetical protein [Actinomycetota bacterium]
MKRAAALITAVALALPAMASASPAEDIGAALTTSGEAISEVAKGF